MDGVPTGRIGIYRNGQPDVMRPYYEDAAVQLFHANCMTVLPSLVDVDAIITDPPYNVSARGVGGRANASVGRVPRKDGTMREIVRDYGDWDHDWNPEPFVDVAGQIIRDGGALVAFTSEFLVAAYLRTVDLDHRGLLFWRKSNPAPSFRNQIVRAIEFAVWQTKGGGWTFNAGGYCPNVWEGPIINGYTYQNTNEQRWHPTQKPEWLIGQWVDLFTNPGDLIVDPFGGSGTTAVVAKRLGRRCIIVEQEEQYCEVAAKRLEQGALELGFSNHSAVDPVGRVSEDRSRATGFDFGER